MRLSTVLTLGLSLLLLGLAAQARPKQFKVSIAKKDVDLVNRTIHFKSNRAIESVELKVYDEEGDLISEKLELFEGAAAGEQLKVTWPELVAGTDNFRIELKFTDTNEFWVGTTICRFEGYIDHEEVVFESGKWDIRPEQAKKLDAVMPDMNAMIERAANCDRLGVALYVAGYTDTVGSISDNRELSRQRARAIAQYFLNNGLKSKQLAVYVRGFGEEVLAVETGDSVDEERNRRADYIISNSPPEIPGPGSWVRIK
jgi:outer membrane protein OmpA-like peptidoglycan-associated protein